MEELTVDAIGEWESEGEAPAQSEARFSLAPPPAGVRNALTGTVNQIDWAEQIKERVGKDFDRVANAMKSVAAKQVERDRSDTQELIAILKEIRAGVRAKDRAGYAISFDRRGFSGAVLLPVTGMIGAPLAGAVTADLAILWIGGALLTAALAAAALLAHSLRAHRLFRMAGGRLELLVAITAAPFTHPYRVKAAAAPYSSQK